jgi:hypothetical protein
MSFYTTINCMDGRVQFPVISYLMERFVVRYVDVIAPARLVHCIGQSTIFW